MEKPLRARVPLLVVCLAFLAACEPEAVGEDGGSNDAGRIDAGGSEDGGTDPCPTGLTECNGTCVDLESSASHCGECGNACSTDEVCRDSTCVLECGDRTECNGACVNTQTDSAHCGECGNACAANEVCDRGNCALECSGGLVACGTSCVDTSSDAAHCGDCDSACEAPDNAVPVCARSECAWECVAGFDDCDGDPSNGCESDLEKPSTCGSCTNVCSGGPGTEATCVDGACVLDCAGGQLDCDGDPSNGCEVEEATIVSVASITPDNGETLLGRAPVITVTFTGAVLTTVGTVRLVGDMGTDIAYDLATAPPEVVFTDGDTVMVIDPARTFTWGETLTLSWSGLRDARCTVGTAGEVSSPTWSITVNPCEPGRAGMIGTTRTDLPSMAVGHPTEQYLMVDSRADGWAYIGGLNDLVRLPKAGGSLETGLFATIGIDPSGTPRPGYKLYAVGDAIYWLTRDRGTSGMIYRLSNDGGTTWSMVDYASFATRPIGDFRGIVEYGGLLYLITDTDSPDLDTEIWSIPATSDTVPVEGTLVTSFTAGEARCGSLAMDDAYFYTTCSTTEHLIRVDRATGAVELLPGLGGPTLPAITDNGTQAIGADDVDGDGRADYLYVQTEYEETYVVCAPAGPLSEAHTRSHFDFGARNGNWGMWFDGANDRIWLFQDRADAIFYIE